MPWRSRSSTRAASTTPSRSAPRARDHRDTPGPDHPDVATLLHNLGGLHHARGNFATAEPLRPPLGRDPRASARRRPYRRRRRPRRAGRHPRRTRPPDEAEALLLTRSTRFERHYGTDHYEVAVTLTTSPRSRSAAATRPAEALYRRALAIKEALLGPEHPDVAITLNNLAVACQMQSRDREAAELLAARSRSSRTRSSQVTRHSLPAARTTAPRSAASAIDANPSRTSPQRFQDRRIEARPLGGALLLVGARARAR